MQVSVPSDRCEESNRCFGTFTQDLQKIVEWLKTCGIKRVVMESTGVYWISIFLMLQEAGMEALLVNAKEAQNVAGRKSDVSDADWLRFLGSCNMVKPCYQVEAVSRRLRVYNRLRMTATRDMARDMQHMLKSMEQMNIKLGSVLSDISGESGMKIIHAILGGERDGQRLAALASSRCKKSKQEIAMALEGTWDPEHLFGLRAAMDSYEFHRRQADACEREMETFLNSYPMESVIDGKDKPLERSGKQVTRKSRVCFDVEAAAYLMYKVNLMLIPGVSHLTLLTFMSELGPNFVSKFATPEKFCRWLNLTPDDKVTGGAVKSSKVPKRKNPVGQALRQCALCVQRREVPLGQYYRRMKGRLGPAQAVVATAHKIAKIIYLMVQRGEEYREEYMAKSEKAVLEKKLAKLEKHRQYLEKQLTKVAG